MARNALPVTHHEAQRVLMPAPGGRAGTIEAVRVTVFGSHFPQRAIAPELLVGGQRAEHVSIARDQRSLTGYFAALPREGAPVLVRYGDSLEGVLEQRFSHERVLPLRKSCAS